MNFDQKVAAINEIETLKQKIATSGTTQPICVDEDTALNMRSSTLDWIAAHNERVASARRAREIEATLAALPR